MNSLVVANSKGGVGKTTVDLTVVVAPIVALTDETNDERGDRS